MLDLDGWRQEGERERIDAFARAHGATTWFDQDARNATFAGRWHQLDAGWNAQNSLWFWRDLAINTFGETAVDAATTSPRILHFEGPSVVKPWHYLCPHPYTVHYRRLFRDTPWGSMGLSERTLVNRAIRLVPARHRLAAYARVQRTKVGLR